MNASLLVACPHCDTLNRVPADRLAEGGTCGRCRRTLLPGSPIALTAGNFDIHAGKSDLPLLVDFWAPWCGPCLNMAPAFAAAASRLEPNIRLGKLNTEEDQSLAARFGIRSIPTLILFYQGRELARQSGAMPTDQIVQWTLAHSPHARR